MPPRKNRRRPNGAEDKVARRAKRNTSAKAQSKYIVSLAKSINVIKHELKDHSVPLMWECNLQQTQPLRNAFLGGPGQSAYNKSSALCVIPLTSVGDPESGAIPNTQSGSSFPSLVGGSAHTPVQPWARDIGDTNQPHVGASWMKLYNQRVHMCFRQNDLQVPVRFKLYVVRLARPEDGSSLDSTLLASRRCIDGENLVGAPQAREDFEQDRDFYASDGFTTVSSGTPGAIDNVASALFSLNTNKYTIEHQRSFVLGPMPRRVSSTSQVVRPYIPAVQATPDARDYYECAFDIKYGGVKIMAPTHKDNTTTKEEPITIMDVKYKDIRSDILRWVVIAPDINTMETPVNGLNGHPVYTMRSTISARVPA